MPFVPGFKNDVLISYAHADNTDGWVDKFEQGLLNRLRQYDRNAAFVIWRDHKLRGADLWTEEIETQLRSSAVLVSILSPNGLDSNWCQRERQCFEQAAATSGGFRIGKGVRAFKLTTIPPENDRHRAVFETLGYEFYERLPSGNVRRFYPEDKDTDFKHRLDELAQDLWVRLKELRARAQSPAPALTVYVASVAGYLEAQREAIVQQFAAWNCRVLPEVPLPSASPRLRAAIDEGLKACSLSVHCVGATRAFIPEGEDQPVDVVQLECARAAGVDRMVFQEATVHESMKSALEAATAAGSEERITPPRIDVLLQVLEDRVRFLRTSPTARRTIPKVFVICDRGEWEVALQIKGCLEAEGRFGAVMPLRDADDERIRIRDLRGWLKVSDAVVVYSGSAEDPWFRDQQREVIAAQKKRRGQPLRSLCIGSPPDPARDYLRLPDFPFEQVADVECRTLRPLLRYLEARDEGASA